MFRVFYAAGPGNAFATFRAWKEGRRDLSVSHVAYSRQLYEACARHGAAALITCSHEGEEEQSSGDLSIIRRKDPSFGKSGIAYHRGLHQKAHQEIQDALNFGANIVIVSGDASPAYYDPLRRRGVQIVQALHTRLWREDRPPTLMQRFRLRSVRKNYATGATLVLSASNIISHQVESLDQTHRTPILEFLPLYYPEHYSGLPAPDTDAERLDILFVSRIEVDKGALDLVSIAARLRASSAAFRFHVCGVGGGLEAMKQMVGDQRLSEHFVFHGWCDRDALRRVMTMCQVSIVPTRSDFVEGFNQAVVESILSGRPVVASSICPSVHYVGDAVEIVQADDVSGYADALQALHLDRAKLLRRKRACLHAGRRFIDEHTSFGAALDEMFVALREGRPFEDRRIPTDAPRTYRDTRLRAGWLARQGYRPVIDASYRSGFGSGDG